MFYTKYRPQTFSQIFRTSEAAIVLAKQISTGKTVHAYLFVGPRGIGKTSTARVLAKALNCSNISKSGDPCDVCDMCLAVKNDSLTDLIEIDAASNRGIDDIRALQDKINLAPTYGKHKIYIIDEVHMLTPPAFNALLKTLEEPPANVTFILCTTEFHKVPDTIKSRCQVFRFKRATTDQLVEKLNFIIKSEGHKADDALVKKVAQASLGGYRDAETLLQQVLEGGVSIDSILSSSNKETYIKFLEYLKNDDKKNSLELINTIYEEGMDLYIWVGEFISYVRDILLLKSGFSENYLDLPSELVGQMKQQCDNMPYSCISDILDKFLEAHSKVKKSFIPQLPVEIAIIDVCGEEALEVPENKKPVSPKPLVDKKIVSTGVDSNHVEVKKEKMKDKEKTDVSIENIDPVMDVTEVDAQWGGVLKRMQEVSEPLLAMLKSAKPVGVRGKFLILEVYFAFHKERLESLKNRKIVEDVFLETFNVPLSVMCEVSNDKPKKLREKEVGVLTDVNVVPVDASEIMGVFDGGLPL